MIKIQQVDECKKRALTSKLKKLFSLRAKSLCLRRTSIKFIKKYLIKTGVSPFTSPQRPFNNEIYKK